MQIYVLKIILVKFLKQWILIMEPTWCYRTSLKHSKWSAWSDCPWSWTLYDEILTLKRSFPMLRGWRLQHDPPFIIWQKNQASNSRTDKAILGVRLVFVENQAETNLDVRLTKLPDFLTNTLQSENCSSSFVVKYLRRHNSGKLSQSGGFWGAWQKIFHAMIFSNRVNGSLGGGRNYPPFCHAP